MLKITLHQHLLSNYTIPEDIEALFVEIVIGNIKWFFCCSNNPHKSMITYHLQGIGKGLEFYTSNYEKILLMGEFNSASLTLKLQ